MVNPEITRYIEQAILPVYAGFDRGHDLGHARKVIDDSLTIAENYPVDLNMVYVIAAYHDLGLQFGRERHEITSAELLAADSRLSEWFSPAEKAAMAEAVADHRASNKNPPRGIYGKIVAEADRDVSYATILLRTLQYGLAQYPDLSFEEHFERAFRHIQEKYGENGYLKLWLETEKNRRGLEEIRARLRGKSAMRADFETIYNDESERTHDAF